MFLRCKVRRKDGKQHRYWSVVENTRIGGGRVVQRHVLYLGEINNTQELGWRRAASGDCTVSGFSAARWPTCWAKMPGWRKSTSCTAVTTGCWGTSKRSSIIWWGGGAICSISATTFCSTI